jgi:hypothetical protein
MQIVFIQMKLRHASGFDNHQEFIEPYSGRN